jgi:outer membrane protein assembly factor BamD
MHIYRITLLWGICCLSALPRVARSQTDFNQPPPSNFEESGKKGPDRKSPGLFHRPVMPTPPEQLKYANQLRAEGRIHKAMRQYNNLVHAWHGSPEAAIAQHTYADMLYEQGRLQSALDEYQYLATFYRGSFPFDDVMQRELQIANTVRTMHHGEFMFFPGILDPPRAIPLFESIVQSAPTWPGSEEALFQIAMIHEDDKEYVDAAAAYERLLQRYPNSRYAPQSSLARARSLRAEAIKRLRDLRQVNDAIAAYFKFTKLYPSDPNVPTAQSELDDLKTAKARMLLDVAVYYEEKERNIKAAIIAYMDLQRSCPMSEYGAQAQAKTAELKEQESANDHRTK